MSDPDRTRVRILEAAKAEFAQEGFAGARVDAIARLAGSNKQLIYHYFGDKEGLFKAVMLDVLNDRMPMDLRSRADFGAQFARAYEDLSKRRTWMRLMMWEALAYEERPVLGEEERRGHGCKVQEELGRLSSLGILDRSLVAPHVMLAMMAMMIFPWVFPQITRHLTGQNPSDPAFKKAYGEALKGIIKRLGVGGADSDAG